MSTIEIKGRAYAIERVPNSSLMFLAREGGAGKSLSGSLDGVWLTDKNGTLEVIR